MGKDCIPQRARLYCEEARYSGTPLLCRAFSIADTFSIANTFAITKDSSVQ